MRHTRIFSVLAVSAALAALFSACKGGTRKPVPTRAAVTGTERQFAAPAEGDFIAIFTTSLGEIRAVLYPDAAPMAVYNFVGLARSGYYDNTTIWRAQYGFAVQGGDATGTGTGGSTIWNNQGYAAEPTDTLRHYAGALCTAMTPGDAASGESQFYFVTALPNSVGEALQKQLTDSGYSAEAVSTYAAAGGLPYLDNTDTVFGQIYSGMEIADRMAAVDTVQDEAGNDTFHPTAEAAITIQKVTIANYPGPSAEELAGTADTAAASSAG